jgi:hypothetical protein
MKFINVATFPRNEIDYGDGSGANSNIANNTTGSMSAGNANDSTIVLSETRRFDVGGSGLERLAIVNGEFSYNDSNPRTLSNINLSVGDRKKVFVIGTLLVSRVVGGGVVLFVFRFRFSFFLVFSFVSIFFLSLEIPLLCCLLLV